MQLRRDIITCNLRARMDGCICKYAADSGKFFRILS